MTALPAKHLFTISELARIGEAGVFGEDDRVELIEGEIIEMSPVGIRHAACVRRLANLLARQVGDEALVDVQNPLLLSEVSQPQPDVALLRPRADFYANHHPRPDDVLLLIEVADTSLTYDRQVKLPIYARSGIPEVWLVDLASAAVETFREPRPEGFASSKRLTHPETSLELQGEPRIHLTLAQLFD